MYYLVVILTAVLGTQVFAMPQVLKCDTSDNSQFILKGLTEADDGNGYKSYTLVNMQDDSTLILSVGLLGEEQAQGFVAFSGLSDQFSESMIQRFCPEQEKSGSIKTLVLNMQAETAAPPMCLSCFEQ